ncbi:hypothetical protein [Kribbella sp. NPDC004536]|uniref:hypothetical protein n=1 Tax=Kribbella sp. NPDC004536 TaxID=3364106 RepID=UPI0036A1688B
MQNVREHDGIGDVGPTGDDAAAATEPNVFPIPLVRRSRGLHAAVCYRFEGARLQVSHLLVGHPAYRDQDRLSDPGE